MIEWFWSSEGEKERGEGKRQGVERRCDKEEQNRVSAQSGDFEIEINLHSHRTTPHRLAAT